MTASDPLARSDTMPMLVGREQEQAHLRDLLCAALAGRGSLVLIGGEAGIGKTSLAESLCHEAEQNGVMILVGRCYDLTETPPYGLWIDLFARYRPTDDSPPLPEAFRQRGTVGAVASQAALFNQVQDFLGALVTRHPVVLLLDDLHWADPASLDLLRFLARSLSAMPLLMIVTYRADELTRRHPLYQLLPVLVRETHANRLDLQRIEMHDIRALIAARYVLPDAETERLVSYLHARSEGNPFFLGELLHTLESERILRRIGERWTLGDLTQTRVPMLLRQVIDGRLARLDDESQQLLAVASVIGQDVSLTLWTAIAERDEEIVLAVVEQAIHAHIIDASADVGQMRFVHALIREALYEGILPTRRRVMHRRIGEALAASPNPEPDAVAYHFRQAGDRRAIEWTVKAGEQAQRAYAWITAAERYEATLALMATHDEKGGERGWLLYQLARMRRAADPRSGMMYLEEAEQVAEAVGDKALTAIARFLRGLLLVRVGEQTRGLEALAAGTDALEALSQEEMLYLSRRNLSEVADLKTYRGTLIAHLATSGRYAEALAMGERFLAVVPTPTGEARGDSGYADGLFGLTTAYGMLGQVAAAKGAIGRARAVYRAVGHHMLTGWAAWHELTWLVLPYEAERVAARRGLAAEAEAAWQHASTAGFAISPRFAQAHLLVLEGGWEEAYSLAYDARTNALAEWRNEAMSLLGSLARRQGDTDRAWEQVRGVFPAGAATEPGDMQAWVGAVIQRLAASLALEAEDLPTARQWLEAHDRWLAWRGAVLGRVEGELGWAQYYQAAGDVDQAQQHATQALAHASNPRQPLALLAADRLLGELDTDARRYVDAAMHLDISLALADACAAPYERALTLLAIAALRIATDKRAEASVLIEEVRAICLPLGAKPALARADALVANLTAETKPIVAHPAGLSAREVEVLRLVVDGLTNAQVAERLFLSPHTINSHLTAIYNKLGVPSRSAAVRFALDHDLR